MTDELDPLPKAPKRDREEAELDVPAVNASTAKRVRRDHAAGLESSDGSDTTSTYSDGASGYSDSDSHDFDKSSHYSDATSHYSDKENLPPDGSPARRARGPLLDITEDFGAFADSSGAPILVPLTPRSLSGQSDKLSHSSASTVTIRAAAPDHGVGESGDEGTSSNKTLDRLRGKFKEILKAKANEYYSGKSGLPEHSGGQEDERAHEEPVSDRTHAWLKAQQMEAVTENAPDKSASQIGKAFEAIHAAIEVLQREGVDADICQAMKRMVEQVEEHGLDGGRTAAPASHSAAESLETSRSDLLKSREGERTQSRSLSLDR